MVTRTHALLPALPRAVQSVHAPDLTPLRALLRVRFSAAGLAPAKIRSLKKYLSELVAELVFLSCFSPYIMTKSEEV